MGGEYRITYIVFGEQVEGAEDFVVLEVKGPRQLKVALEDGQGRRLDDKVLWGPCG